MGCSINKENIESKILIVQLKKIKIKDERKKEVLNIKQDIKQELNLLV